MQITSHFVGTDTIGATPYRIGFGTNHAVKVQFELEFGWKAVGTMLAFAAVWASRGRCVYHYHYYRSPRALPQIYSRPTHTQRRPIHIQRTRLNPVPEIPKLNPIPEIQKLNPVAETQEPLQDKGTYHLLQGAFLGICGWNMLAALVAEDNADNITSDDNADNHKNQNDADYVESQITSLTVRSKDLDLEGLGRLLFDDAIMIGQVQLGGVTWNVDVQQRGKLVGFYLTRLDGTRHQIAFKMKIWDVSNDDPKLLQAEQIPGDWVFFRLGRIGLAARGRGCCVKMDELVAVELLKIDFEANGPATKYKSAL